MIDVFKYSHGIYRTQDPQFTPSQIKTKTNSLKITEANHKTKIRSNYFTKRAVNTRNTLPEDVVTSPSLNAFKARLDSFWKGHSTMYDPECYQVKMLNCRPSHSTHPLQLTAAMSSDEKAERPQASMDYYRLLQKTNKHVTVLNDI